MALTQYYVASSIDGFIADSSDRIDWLLQFGFEAFDEHYQRFLSGIGAIVMGAATYDFLLADPSLQWPYAGIPTWVVTHRSLPVVEGADITFFEGDLAQLDTELRDTAGDRDVWVVGGGSIAAQFADAGLLDELHVTYMPVLVGSGKPLLPVSEVSRPLELLRTTPFTGGAIEHVYRVA
ncbi:dihydrofolate reductase family protein [Leifsonia poae]|uniref:Dihydrofolate reductase n=1 Tax=Leifsonia poae TaxID=110933 RepID=A0A9W6M201_9MICO|nr:dihydrofolate reductase family protein [Leifsonia poae]GLJ78287.1 dihydrofolate reductase [Leifsonia poae]